MTHFTGCPLFSGNTATEEWDRASLQTWDNFTCVYVCAYVWHACSCMCLCGARVCLCTVCVHVCLCDACACVWCARVCYVCVLCGVHMCVVCMYMCFCVYTCTSTAFWGAWGSVKCSTLTQGGAMWVPRALRDPTAHRLPRPSQALPCSP